ncbi:MAG: radical SAM protein [Phycisphaerae bacterium]|nr:radical SAM protein [Phycisphaerae bacterium]
MKDSSSAPFSPPDDPRTRMPATDVPPQDGRLEPLLREPSSPPLVTPSSPPKQRSGQLHRPINEIRREAVNPHDAVTELERYKVAMRRFSPVQRGRKGLPWEGEWQCDGCAARVPGRLLYQEADDSMYLEYDCPTCGQHRERHADALFVKRIPQRPELKRQPKTTHSSFKIRPIQTLLPRTVETLCPECSALILGRYHVFQDAVWIEKTCPDHGYFRDKINSDVDLYLRGTVGGFEDERGVHKPQVTGGNSCPADCGLCNQHHSTSCLAQIDLTNRCNLNCPVCFASANQAGYVSEPTYEMVIEMLRALREQHPVPATAIQFTGGEPTIHPRFHDLCQAANDMGFSHVQIATNGLKMADLEFTRRAADTGLHTLYLQFDGVNDEQYKALRGRPLLETKLKVIENCRQIGLKICLVPTIVNNVNRDQVAEIFKFACRNADVISGISYQPVSFSGRISMEELEQKRYTLGDLAHDIAEVSGADIARDFFPLNHVVPLSRMLQTLDGKPKIRPSCHSDCAFGSYFFITPDHEAIAIPKLFDTMRLFRGFNEYAARVEATRPNGMANWRDKLEIMWVFLRSYRWTARDYRVTPFTFIKALRGMTSKTHGRGDTGERNYRTLLAAGMHFMDRYNFDTERIRRCVIQYSTVDGIYPFCTINCGPTYRPYIEKMHARRPGAGDPE